MLANLTMVSMIDLSMRRWRVPVKVDALLVVGKPDS
jgi:hypothetical protein